METVERGTSFFDAFRIADDILRQAVQGISDIITVPGIINRDFADVKAIMHGQGYAVMGTAVATGTNRAVDAANRAISSPLARRQFHSGRAGHPHQHLRQLSALSLHEVHEASTVIQKAAHENANIIFGAVHGRHHEGRREDHRDRRGLQGSGQEERGQQQKPSFLPRTWKAGRDVPVQQELPQAPPPQPPPSVVHQVTQNVRDVAPEVSKDDLDVPTFLRRQAQKA